MSERFLDKIVQKTRERVSAIKDSADVSSIRDRGEKVRALTSPHRLRNALERKDGINIIAEIKRASPSKGVINADIDIVEVARSYEAGGAAAISVLTETEHFGGSLVDLFAVFQEARIPILRKDFIVDEYQVWEAAEFGADAILLIVAALSPSELVDLGRAADELGMDALIEVHTLDELKIASDCGAKIIGVNNRDLQSLEVSLDVSRELVGRKPEGASMVAESGISTREQVAELRGIGFDGFLIGESLMRSDDPAAALRELV
jgi:indole-3-glycerol phosphate synthase